MQRWNDLKEVPAGFGPSVVTIGNFDGVHRGHLTVLGRLVALARAEKLASVAITFEPHPVAVLHPERAPQPLSSTEHKLELIAEAGVDAMLVMRFTQELALWSPRRFVEDALVKGLGAQVVVVGGDTRFGHRNSGDVNTMRALGAELGFTVDVVSEVHGLDAARRWSSTWIRELIDNGDVEAAAEVLGHPHRVTGEVVHGDHRGRELGYPTANLSQQSIGAVPADGVYAGWLVRTGGADQADHGGSGGARPAGRLPAAISIGTNPTFAGTQRRIEAYVLDRVDLDLYGQQVAIEFVRRLRPTLRFDDVGQLVRQMADDVQACRAVLGVVAGS